MKNFDAVITLVKEAGVLALKHFGNVEVVEKKGVGDLLTVADKEVEIFLRERLTALFPEDAIIGEEEGTVAGCSDRTWIIDPIDGTADYANRLPTWAISVALVEHGNSIAACVYAPLLAKLYTAARGKGAYLNDKQIFIREAPFNASSYFTANASAHLTFRHELKMRMTNAPTALAPCLVAEGIALGSLTIPAYIWDVAACSLIATEAGARFQYFSGREFALAPLLNRTRMDECLVCGSHAFIDHCAGKLHLV